MLYMILILLNLLILVLYPRIYYVLVNVSLVHLKEMFSAIVRYHVLLMFVMSVYLIMLFGFYNPTHILDLLILSITNDISYCHCGFFHFSLQSSQFLLQVFQSCY